MIIHLPDIPPWVACLVTLLVPSPLALLKGVRPLSIISAVKQIIPVVALFITVAEDSFGPGTGAEKKAKVVSDIKTQLPTITESLGLPSFVVGILTNDQVLSVVIDLLVNSANAAGTFVQSAPEVKPVDPAPVS